MGGFSTFLTILLVAVAIRYMTGGARKRAGAALSPDGMRVLQNKRIGWVILAIFLVMGGFFLFFGVLCWEDIGMGQGGVVLLFFGMGGGCVLFGVLMKTLSDRNRICFDERRIIQYRALGKPVEMEWWEVMEYSCNPQRTYLVSADRRRISTDYTYDGHQELVEMIQEKVASRQGI